MLPSGDVPSLKRGCTTEFKNARAHMCCSIVGLAYVSLAGRSGVADCAGRRRIVQLVGDIARGALGLGARA